MDHLGAHVCGDVTDVETTLLLHGDRAVHEHLQEQIAQLLAECRRVGALDRLEHLVGLLEQVWTQAAVSLLAVPWTAAGCAQPLDDLVERAQRVDGLVTHGRSTEPQPARAAAPGPDGRARGATDVSVVCQRVADVELGRRRGHAAKLVGDALQIEAVIEGQADHDAAAALGFDAERPGGGGEQAHAQRVDERRRRCGHRPESIDEPPRPLVQFRLARARGKLLVAAQPEALVD